MNSTEKFTPVNTCVAVDFRVEMPEIAKAKNLLTGLGSKYSIEPHATLLLMPTTAEMFEAMKGELITFLENLGQFKIKIGTIEYEEERRFVQLSIKSEDISTIHQALLAIATKYRNNELREKDIQRIELGKYLPEDIQQLIKYGFVFAGGRFGSHITIGNIPDDKNSEEILKQIRDLLADVINRDYLVEKVALLFHTDAPDQAEMKELWKETVALQGQSLK